MGIVRRQKGNIMKHTPGKWNVTRTHATEDTHHHEVLARDTEYHREVVICECFPINDDGQIDSESAANARLIAAAPELLAATKRMINWLEGLSDEIDIIDMALQARAAIAKAEGN